MSSKRFKVVRADGEVIYDATIEPTVAEDGHLIYELDEMPLARNGDSLIVTSEPAAARGGDEA